MPVHVVKDETDPGSQVALHLPRIPIPQLVPTSDCSDKTVKGKVVIKGPLVSLDDDDFVLKSVIEEEDTQHTVLPEHKSINVILFGGLAKDFSKSVSQGDIVLAAGFTLGKSPTAHKDRLHPCNLLLSGDDAFVYVFRATLQSVSRPLASASNKRPTSPVAEVLKPAKGAHYTYVPLSDLKPGEVVNVYAIVTFFKQPFKTRGTDYCSTLKITDQSNRKVGCTIFCEKLDDHPKIFKMGDIVRLHRVKPQLFNGTVSLLTSFGFSAVTFDGTVGSEVAPRTSSKAFQFGPGDRQAVEELRAWAATQDLFPAEMNLPLSAVQPNIYFDLTCRLLAKAPVDSSCTLLKVWDGTKCVHPLLNMLVEPSVLEGDCELSDQKGLTANVLVYDNHVEAAQRLKPGDYLRIYNLHVLPGNNRLPGITAAQVHQSVHLVFHLHGGTAYGRGIQILPDDSPAIQELKRIIDSSSKPNTRGTSDLSDSELMEVYGTPPESNDTAPVRSATERTCHHRVKVATLAEVKGSAPPKVFHVRVQLKSCQPQRLYQSLKLHCPKCKSLQEVPEDSVVARLFSEALKERGPCSVDWSVSGKVDLPGESPSSPQRTLTLHLPNQLVKKEGITSTLTFLRGTTFDETCLIAESFTNLVPVKVSQGSMSLLDLSAPFLFQGKKRYYGCKQCSQVTLTEPFSEGVEVIDEKTLSEGLGVQLLEYCLVMKLELQDDTGTLETLLWRDAELFFEVSAEDAAFCQEAQDRIQHTISKLCPPSSSRERPWLDMCVRAYRIKENNQDQTCYQVCHTHSTVCPPRP